MSGITFGSVGDIIAVGQIAWALAQALADSRGSAKDYQGLVKDLQAFDQALLQVIALWQNYEDSPELEELGATTKDVVKDSREILLAFRLKVDKKYGTSLAPGGSGKWLKDTSKKVLWLKEKDDMLELRRKLQMASDTISMLCLAAIGNSNKLDSAAQRFRVELVHTLLRESIGKAEEQMMQLKQLDEKLTCQVKATDVVLNILKSGIISLSQVHTIVFDMKNLLSVLHSHILSQQATPRGLGTHWQQEPVTLEDALGHFVRIPLELVNSWEMFDMILSKRFEKHRGHEMVRTRKYVIEEGSNGQELSRSSDLAMCLRPGQKIDMTMVFPESLATGNSCPRCQTKSVGSMESRIQCENSLCKMWFQRIVETDGQHIFAKPMAQILHPSSSDTKTLTSENPLDEVDPPHPSEFQRAKLPKRRLLNCSMCNGVIRTHRRSQDSVSCSSCNLSYHLTCALPAVLSGLSQLWRCPRCESIPQGADTNSIWASSTEGYISPMKDPTSTKLVETFDNESYIELKFKIKWRGWRICVERLEYLDGERFIKSVTKLIF